MRHVNLDNQSASPVLPEALAAMRPFFSEAYGNPASLHQRGLAARDALAAARSQIAAFLNAESPDGVIFTSDGTESANLAIQGSAWANERRGNHIVLSAIEHPAVNASVAFLERHGFTATRVKVDSLGFIDPDDVRAAITRRTILIATHYVNHDIGTVQPVERIAAIAADRGVTLFVDAEAAAGWLPVDAQKLGDALISFSPHRFQGPTGVGVLYRNRRARLVGILHGGDQENGRRAGVENVPAIVGAGVAAEAAQRAMPSRSARSARLQKRLWEKLKASIPRLRLNGPEPGPGRSPANLNLSVEFIEGEGLALLADVNGIAIGAGTSCVSKALGVSPTLAAIGLEPSLALGSVILSLGPDNTTAEIDHVARLLPKLVARLRALSPAWAEFQRDLAPPQKRKPQPRRKS